MDYVRKAFGKVSTFGNMYVDVDADDADEQRSSAASAMWSALIFGLTVYALVVSWHLNRDMRVRALVGFTKPAGFIGTLAGLLAVSVFGPVLYLFALITGAMDEIGGFMVVNGSKMSWLDAMKSAGIPLFRPLLVN